MKLFRNRADKLDKIKIDLHSGRTIEEFDYDREDTMMSRLTQIYSQHVLSVKKNHSLIYIDENVSGLEYFKNQKLYWNNMKIEFYHINRLDNLVFLEADDTKIQINFINRWLKKLTQYVRRLLVITYVTYFFTRLDHLLSYTVYFNPETVTENMKHIKDSVTVINSLSVFKLYIHDSNFLVNSKLFQFFTENNGKI